MTISLRDGRKVTLEEYGDPAGSPALWFHGAFSSRLEGGFLDRAAQELGLRLLSLDRPGAGGSDPLPGRTIAGYAADVADVLNELEIEQAAVGGLSNGGMYTMAVASALPDRVLRAVPLNPTVPVADEAAWATLPRKTRKAYRYLTDNSDRLTRSLAGDAKPPGRIATALSRRANPDAHLLDDPSTATAWAANTAECVLQGDSGYLASELSLSCAPWGFDHRAVTVPVVMVSGEKDGGRNHAELWARELPQARLVVLPGGHMNLLDPAVARRIVELLQGFV